MDRTELQPLENSQLFLLCLSSYAFEKADPASLIALCKDLNLASMVKSAVIEWKLEARYPMVSRLKVKGNTPCFHLKYVPT